MLLKWPVYEVQANKKKKATQKQGGPSKKFKHGPLSAPHVLDAEAVPRLRVEQDTIYKHGLPK